MAAFATNVKIKTVGVGPHRLRGRHIAAAPQDPPGSFTPRCRWIGMAVFQVPPR